MNTDQTRNLEEIVLLTIEKAGAFLRRNAFSFGDIEWKKEDNPVTVLDKTVEQMIREDIQEEIPANFTGEEFGYQDNGAEYTFIIDPIDGTKSFIRKEFISSISIGIQENGRLVGGIVYDFMKDIMCVAIGNEAYVLQDGKRHPLNQPNQFKKTKISLDRSDVPQVLTEDPQYSVKHRTGLIALNRAQLASGTFEAYLIHTRSKGNVGDIAAGYYLIEQGGYYITDIDGNAFDYNNQNNVLIAIHPAVADKVIEALGLPKKAS